MTKKCCEYHNRMEDEEAGLLECGIAGMGTPLVCCENCPDNIYGGNAELYSHVLEQREKQANCEHDLKFVEQTPDVFGAYQIYECTKCGFQEGI